MRFSSIAALLMLVAGLSGAPALAQDICKELSDEARQSACDAAIAAEADATTKADLLFWRGYSRVDLFDYDGALKDFGDVLAINPRHARAYHEQAYVFTELGEFPKALASLDEEIKLTPNDPNAHQERSVARFAVGDVQGTYDDLSWRISVDPGNPEAHLFRARLKMWLGRFDEATAEINEALEMSHNNPDVVRDARVLQRHLKAWTTATPSGDAAKLCSDAADAFAFGRDDLIGDCSAAYFAETDNKRRANYLFVRSYAWLYTRNDDLAANEDMRMTIALEPTNAGWYSNLGYFYIQMSHSWAAEREFDRSLAIETTFGALAGRATARFNLGKIKDARADAKASFDLKPNMVALTVLGDIAFTHDKDEESAKQYWMAAYHLGSPDDGLMARLKEVGIANPEQEPRQ